MNGYLLHRRNFLKMLGFMGAVGTVGAAWIRPSARIRCDCRLPTGPHAGAFLAKAAP
ncbi:MAG: twin-arginine translocation signal domain-containing protein [Candidatus Binataceae bacterium]